MLKFLFSWGIFFFAKIVFAAAAVPPTLAEAEGRVQVCQRSFNPDEFGWRLVTLHHDPEAIAQRIMEKRLICSLPDLLSWNKKAAEKADYGNWHFNWVPNFPLGISKENHAILNDIVKNLQTSMKDYTRSYVLIRYDGCGEEDDDVAMIITAENYFFEKYSNSSDRYPVGVLYNLSSEQYILYSTETN
jgi:hypothetical protein